MSNDLVALSVLVASDSASEREAFKDAAAQASVHIDICEVGELDDAGPACRHLNGNNIDLVFLDCRMPRDRRQTVIGAARGAASRPLVISIGAADPGVPIAAEKLDVDGSIGRPVRPADARSLLEACVRARMPSRVLIVDDSATVRTIMRKVLQSCRYRFEVEEAADGAAALEQAGKQSFDLVLLDYNMPGLDGFATMSRFLEKHGDTKLVMVTATNDVKLAGRARAAGAHDLLFKPFYAKDVDALMNRLYRLSRA
jgi:CheY-like chemotaxis protein